MKLVTLLFVVALIVGCDRDKQDKKDSKTPESIIETPDLTEEEVEPATQVSFTLDDLDSILTRPIENQRDLDECRLAADELSERVRVRTGIRDKAETVELDDCVIQIDKDGDYTKHFPDGKRLRMSFQSVNRAYLNLFARGAEKAILHISFDESSMMISSHDSDPVGTLILHVDPNGEFSRGEWNIKDPERLEKFAKRYWSDFKNGGYSAE